MKIDRRCFLSLVVGGAVGTTLTPVPWKLTDDLAIWSQNWPWTPVPEDGPSKYVKSVCTQCPGGCGIVTRTIKNKAVKIEGLADHPINRGNICSKAISATQHLYGPSRIKSPMKRSGERGQGKWEKISWNEAIEQVQEKLAELRTKGTPHSLACISDTDKGSVAYLLDRFMRAYGSPNFIRTPTSLDAQELSLYLSCGQQGSVGYDLKNADYILSFGCALMDGCNAAGQVLSAYSDFDRKVELVQVEARLSDTANRASKWIPAKPGTEGILALGIGHIIVRDKLYNKNFIENFSTGFEDWNDESGNSHAGYRSLVKKYPPDKVADATGLSAKNIEILARSFAGARHPLAISGYNSTGPESLDQALAIFALNALVGNIKQPGGISFVGDPDYLSWTEMKIDETASAGNQQPRVDQAGSDRYPHTRYLLNNLPQAINEAKGDVPVQALFVSGANPLYTMSDTTAVKQAFDKIPFIVSFSTFMDETAEYADLLLPHPHFLECYQDVATPAGYPETVIGLSRPVVKTTYDVRHTGDIIIQIAKRFGGFIENAFPWKNHEDFLRKNLSDKWKTLEKKGYFAESKQQDNSWEQAFNTASGKFEFLPRARFAQSSGQGEQAPIFDSQDLPGDAGEMPLVLVAYTSARIASGPVANTPFMTKTVDSTVISKDEVFVEINPKTAGEYGLSHGDAANLKTPAGQARVRVNLFEGIMPGLIAMPAGLGRTGFSEYIAGKGINVYSLITDLKDPVSGLNTAWGARASLAKA